MKKVVMGILAHVDAGKTTLSESFLYLAHAIRKKGRVDHKDAFLDYDWQERERGITIYSKQARFNWKDTQFILIDTPGHVDFSSEMERSLQVLDCAVLVINGCDGVQSHTETIWNLLKHYQIPTFVFVNKMDISFHSKDKLMHELRQLNEGMVDVSENNEQLYEHMAMLSDDMLERYMDQKLTLQDAMHSIAALKIFPCVFGSALKGDHVELLLDMLSYCTKENRFPKQFGARIFKITHDENQKKWVHMKITGGSLSVKEKIGEDKIDQIRLYSGDKYEMVSHVQAGEICSVSGLNHVQIYDGLGFETLNRTPLLSSYMKYRMLLPEDCDVQGMLRNLQTLSEEDPQLELTYEEELKEIHVQFMGEVQIEILKNLIQERFSVHVEFDQGSVVLKETICECVEGVGHFEPLRHYAEVHLLLEPLPRGSGLVFESRCSEDVLARNWQRLVLTHLEEKVHKGVLTGSPITDMKITLLSGKAHPKHTEGGDFRKATYRAVRQGLRSASCCVLEPYYAFRLVLPATYLSKAIYDIERRHGTFQVEESEQALCVLSGKAPVSKMRDYQMEVLNYTKGAGKLYCSLCGYEPCIDQKEIVEEIGYDCDRDLENPCGSVFCAHGSGFLVPYNEVENYMHLKKSYKSEAEKYSTYRPKKVDDKEVMRVYEMTYGPVQTRLYAPRKEKNEEKIEVKQRIKPQCLLVDGYNVIHAWDQLAKLASENLDAARDRLIDMLANYQGYRGCLLILVFDAYKVKENIGKVNQHGNIWVVYTKTAQTADAYIEKTTKKLHNDMQVSVVSSDAMEQLIVMGQGAMRISAREFEKEVQFVCEQNIKNYEAKQSKAGPRPLEAIRKVNEED